LSQLALPLQLQDHAVFESFWPAGNQGLVAFLSELVAGGDTPGCWIWGKPTTGKSHLLQAVCAKLGDRSMYLPLRDFFASGGKILDGLASRHCVCLDDLDAVVGDPAWELALFTLFNQMRDNGALLVVTSTAPPRISGIGLADLQSRMSMLPVFQLQELSELDRSKALQLRARHRGLDLPADTASYLLARSRRDMASLYALLDRLDAEALRAQRRLTIPFVRSVVGDIVD
jgi:DnaA family protein